MIEEEEAKDDISERGSQKIIRNHDKFRTIHMIGFLFCTVIGREYSGWNIALSQGFGQFMIAQLLTAFAFINYFFCLCEIWSALPFSGGAYGLTRACCGFYPGFLVGIAESLTYVTHTAISALFLGDAICEFAHLPSHATIAFVFIVFVLAVIFSIQNTIVMRRSFVGIAAVSVLILLIWIWGSFKWTDFDQNASLHISPTRNAADNWLYGGIDKFLFMFPYASLPYAGIKSFVLMCGFTESPKVTLPRALTIFIVTLFIINMFVVFLVVAQPGGIQHSAKIGQPLAVGWQLMFNLQSWNTAVEYAAFLSYPAAFAKVFAYVVPSAVLFQSLGRTNLLPSIMMLNHNKSHVPGVMVTALFGFGLSLLLHFRPQINLLGLCLIATVYANVLVCYSYIKLKIHNPNLERGFVNPLGCFGAVLSGLLFLLIFVSSSFFQGTYDHLIGFTVIFAGSTVYYFGFAVRKQTLCKEEDRIFMLLHAKNFNQNKSKRKNRTKKRVAPSAKPLEGSENDSSTANVRESSLSDSQFGLFAQMKKYNPFKRGSVSPEDSMTHSRIRSSSPSHRSKAVSSVAPDVSALQESVQENREVELA